VFCRKSCGAVVLFAVYMMLSISVLQAQAADLLIEAEQSLLQWSVYHQKASVDTGKHTYTRGFHDNYNLNRLKWLGTRYTSVIMSLK
jgi:hypothetical protein